MAAARYFLPSELLFRNAGVCLLLIMEASCPDTGCTSPLLSTSVAKPISKFLAFVGSCVVQCIHQEQMNTSFLGDILDSILSSLTNALPLCC